jgi:alpha-L-rhamnosidase
MRIKKYSSGRLSRRKFIGNSAAVASVALLPAGLTMVTGCSSGKPHLYDLRCENLRDPLGIDNISPRFSWKIRSSRNGARQNAYQIIAASEYSLLDETNADLWNSGRVESGSSVMVPYTGNTLDQGSLAFWKVRVWDESDRVSSWSPVAEFSIGLIGEQQWRASYIGLHRDDDTDECPRLMKSIYIDDTRGRFLLHVNSLGYHEVYLNGKKAGSMVLAPAVSQFSKRSLILTYDISPLVRKGDNNVMLWLGSGWYKPGLPGVLDKGPLVKAQLEHISGKERNILLVTDGSWMGGKSSYTQMGNWRPRNFGGERLDGSMTAGDLLLENHGAGTWKPVMLVEVPAHSVSCQMTETNSITEIIKPVAVSQVADDTFLVDMGKNLTGWIKIGFPKLSKSQEVTIEYADHINENGQLSNQRQIDVYVAAGQGTEVFKNKFNYQGFRYMKIYNLDEPPSLESIEGYLIETGYEPAGAFECSDPEMNQIHDMVFYTLRCLSLGGYLVDCPQIERLGYGGDGNASTETAQIMFEMGPLYSHWMQAWADCIREDGSMPHTAPNPYNAGGGPYWCGFLITGSWRAYMNYGDSRILDIHYPTMKKWLGYVEKHSPGGLLERWPDTDYRNWYLGDWATPAGVDQTDQASVNLVNNCFIAVCYENMERIAGVLDKGEDALIYSRKKDELQKLIHKTFFREATNSYGSGSQIDLAYPLLAGVVPENLKNTVTESLVSAIKITHNGHLATGLVGIPVLTEWAVKNKQAELMYSMLKKKEYPGYLYMIANDATTTWEHWEGTRSRIHNCYNGIGSWFYQAVGGILPPDDTPAYSKVVIRPQIPRGISWAKTSRETPYGTLSVNWHLNGNTFRMEVEVPVGMEAEIPHPAGVIEYRMNGKKTDIHKGGISAETINSGKYEFVYRLA